jgi:hypothetical protein
MCTMMCASVAAQVSAAPLPLPLHILEVTVHGEKRSASGSDINSLLFDHDEFSNQGGGSQSGSAVAATFGAGNAGRMSPAVATVAHSEAKGGGPNSQGLFAPIQGVMRALARLFYFTRIAEVDAPPVAIPKDSLPLELPVTVTVLGEGEARASQAFFPRSQASGFAAAFVAGLPTGKVEVCDGPVCGAGSTANDGFHGSFDFSFIAGQEIGVILESSSSTVAAAGAEVGHGIADVFVNIDPVFSFNQAAFDEIARAGGFPTFDLARHFAFEYSEGAAPIPSQGAVPIPQPATGWLLIGGLAMLAALRRFAGLRALVLVSACWQAAW